MAHPSHVHHLSGEFLCTISPSPFPFHCLTRLSCRCSSTSVSWCWQWSGARVTEHVGSANLWPRNKWGISEPLTSAGDAHCLIAEYKLCLRAQHLFLGLLCFYFFFSFSVEAKKNLNKTLGGRPFLECLQKMGRRRLRRGKGNTIRMWKMRQTV